MQLVSRLGGFAQSHHNAAFLNNEGVGIGRGIGLYKPYEPEAQRATASHHKYTRTLKGKGLDRAHSLLMILYFLRHLSLLCVTDVDRQTVAFPAFSRVTDTTGRVTYIVNIALLYTLANYCYKYVYTLKDFRNLIFNH